MVTGWDRRRWSWIGSFTIKQKVVEKDNAPVYVLDRAA